MHVSLGIVMFVNKQTKKVWWYLQAYYYKECDGKMREEVTNCSMVFTPHGQLAA